MRPRFYMMIIMPLIILGGCISFKAVNDVDTQKNIATANINMRVPPVMTQAISDINTDMHEHLQFPILKLNHNENSAYPCKLTWSKAENGAWKISRIDVIDNHVIKKKN